MELEDLDKLIAEAEAMLVVEDKEIQPANSKHSKRNPSNDLDEEINEIYRDTVTLEEEALNKQSISPKSNKTIRCFPVFLEGTVKTEKRICDNLRCLECDFSVSVFDNYEWRSDTDYLFLRNNMPDFEKVKRKLRFKRGCRAYACQCLFRNVTKLEELKQNSKWVCGKH